MANFTRDTEAEGGLKYQMAKVINPFFSAWASGTIGKLITCRASYNQRFCMLKHRNTRRKRSPAQIEVQEIGTRKIRLEKNFWQVAEWRSARLGKNKLGLAILGSKEGLIRPLIKLPPLLDTPIV